jgi:hypothetical protein
MDDVSRRPEASGRVSSWLPWLAAAVLFAGVAAGLVTFLHSRNAAEALPQAVQDTSIASQ